MLRSSLIVVILLCGLLLIVAGRQRVDEFQERKAAEVRAIPIYTDEALVNKYYQIEAELRQEYADLQLHGSKTIAESNGNWGTSMGQGFSEGVIKSKIQMLEDIKTALLTEIHKRNLTIR